MGGEIVVVIVVIVIIVGAVSGPAAIAAAQSVAVVLAVLIVVVVVVVVVVIESEARARQRVAETRGAAFHATTRMMNPTDRSPAVPTGEIDNPARSPPLAPPTNGLEGLATDSDGIGQTADLVHLLPLALWTYGHGDSFFDLRCRPWSIAFGCDRYRAADAL
jgi:hypothetical protein